MNEVPTTAVRATGLQRRARESGLALASAGIDYEIERRGSVWLVLVRANDAEAAERVLDAFERENQVPPATPTPAEGSGFVAVVVAVLLLAFHAGVVVSQDAGEWLRRGRASAFWILQGDVWRSVTALTLHVGAAHVAGNAVGCVLFGGGLCRIFGAGVGLLVMLTAGAVGNLVNAVLRGPPHNAVGASTAIFGALGALVAAQFVRRSQPRERRARPWLVVAAGLALLGMLGTGEGTDISAHLFGFLAGLALGAVVVRFLPEPPGPPVQAALTAVVEVLVLLSWSVAWR